MKENTYKLTTAIAGIILGIFLIEVEGDALFEIIFEIISSFIGAMIVMVSFPSLVQGFRLVGKIKTFQIAFNICAIILGFILMFYWRAVKSAVFIAIGIYMIAFPVFDIIMSAYKSEQFKTELPKILLGVIMILLGQGKIVDVIVNIFGVIIIVIGIIYIISLAMRKKQ